MLPSFWRTYSSIPIRQKNLRETFEEYGIPFIRWGASEEAWEDFRRKHPLPPNSFYSRLGGMPGHDIMWAIAPFGPFKN